MRYHLLLALIAFALLTLPALAQAPTPEQKKQTIAYLHSQQRGNAGGFAPDKTRDAVPTLPATSSAIRALKYWGGELKNKDACKDFVKSCFQKEKGFAALPDGKPDVRSTALGMMAMVELGILAPDRFSKDFEALDVYFGAGNVKTFEDRRISAAAFEAMQVKPDYTKTWIDEILKTQNADGTFGKDNSVPGDTAGAVVTVLRLGGELKKRDEIVKALKAGQLKDGGWSKDGKESDLETTYRVMRALVMLKAKPDADALRKFVETCRQKDGSYAAQPNGLGSISATYFAGIVHHWLDAMK